MAYYSYDSDFDKSRGVFSFLCALLHPKSKGSIRLTSSIPDAPLKIDLNYLSVPEDIVPLRAGLKLALRIGENMRDHGYPLEEWQTEIPQGEDDESLDKFIRRRNRTTYHYSSTCRMGPREDFAGGGAVVNEQLKVFGFEGLRVADASVFPWVLGVHLQAPVVMVAEKCADMILSTVQK
jgi:choline dehydrogenase-like flavoprotein